MVLIFIAMLLSIQVRAYPTHLGEVRSNWVDILIWKRRMAKARLERSLPGFNPKWWRQKVTFNEGGGLSIRPRWHIKHKHAIYRVAIGILLMVITTLVFGSPIGVAGAVITSGGGGGNWSVGGSWVGGVAPGIADDAIVAAGDTINVDLATQDCLSIEVQIGGVLSFPAPNNLRTNGVNGAGFCVDMDGTLNHGSGLFTLIDDTANNANMDWVGEGGNPFDILVTYRDRTTNQTTSCTCEGGITFTTGTWDSGAAGGNFTLDVAVETLVNGGAFNGNASTVGTRNIEMSGGTYNSTSAVFTIDGRDAGLFMLNFTGGVFNHLNGTVTFNQNSGRGEIRVNNQDFYDVIVGGQGRNYRWRDPWTITNDLNINETAPEGLFPLGGASLIVIGDVTIANLGDFDGDNETLTFGSLTIDGGGVFTSTTGNLTLTSETAGGYIYKNDGAFNHNNGIVVMTYAGVALIDPIGTSGNIFNLIINDASANYISTSNFAFDNDLTITAGQLQWNNPAHTLDVVGDVNLTGKLGANSESGNWSMASLFINSGGECDATSGTLTLNGIGPSSNAFRIVPGATYTHNNGLLEATYTGSNVDFELNDDVTFYDFTVNTTNRDVGFFGVTALRTVTVANDLNITTGSLTLEGSGGTDLTVTAATEVDGTLTCNAYTCQFGDSAFGTTYGLHIDGTGVFNGGSGNHSAPSMYFSDTSTVTLTSGITTINGRVAGSAAFAWTETPTFDDGNGTIQFTGTDEQWFHCGSNTARTFYNMTINKASNMVTYRNGLGALLTIDNDFTITSGEFDSAERTTGTSRDLTVTGDVDIQSGGTLTLNASTVSLGSIWTFSGSTTSLSSGTTTFTSKNGGTGYTINLDGTTTHNNGTVEITYAATSLNDINATGNLYNLVLNHASFHFNQVGTTTIDNDLTITAGEFDTVTYGLTVTGDVSITGTYFGNDGTMAFASLTIASGGTYSATSGITTITSETAGGYAVLVDAAGAYVHNNGTLTFTFNSTTLADLGGDSTYNFIVNHATIVVTLDGNGLDVANDLTVTAGEMDCLALGLTVLGDVTLDDVLDGNTSAVSMGSITINSGGLYDATTATTEITSETAGGYSLNVLSGGIYTHNNGELSITYSADSYRIFMDSGTGNLYDFTINSPTKIAAMQSAITMDNALTITDGILDTHASSNYDLTVGGVTIINGGEIDCHSSDVDLNGTVDLNAGGTLTAPDSSGSLLIAGQMNKMDGTFNHSDGTVTMDGSATKSIFDGWVFYDMVCNRTGASNISIIAIGSATEMVIENSLVIQSGDFMLDPRGDIVTLTLGTNASAATVDLTGGRFQVGHEGSASSYAIIKAASSAYPTILNCSVDWDNGGTASMTQVTAQDLNITVAQTVGPEAITMTATRVTFAAALTVTTATLEGTMCTIDVTNLTVSSGLYIEGWFDLTDATRGGYDWILVGGDYTLVSNTTYTARRNFYKPGGATLTLDTGTTLTATDPTVDGTFVTAEADLLDTNNGTFTVKYTMDIKIVNAIGVAIPSVVVTLYDQFDVQLWTQTTDSNGDIVAQATITAIYGIGARQNHPQNMTMVLTGFATLNWNFVLNRPMDYTIGLPAAATPATGGDSAYTDNLTIYRKTGRDDAAQKIYDGGTAVKGSVQQKRIEIDSPTGKVINSTTVIYVPAATAVDVEDKILLEDTTTVQVVAVTVVNAYDGSPDHKVIST